jgi:radical SAM superfamily enzyme YgiQ (UPF0313 family)
MNILLISTYELGRQPFGLASPAAWLRAEGAQVTCLDVSRETLREEAVRAADLIAFYVPMHTATRLAVALLPAVREMNPRAQICFYGLYAPVNEPYLRRLGVGTILGGEFEEGLLSLAKRLQGLPDTDHRDAKIAKATDHTLRGDGAKPAAMAEAGTACRAPTGGQKAQTEPVISLARQKFRVPDRRGLVGLEKYARVTMPDGTARVVGYTEASRGCKHLCRHCPIVPVYQGAFRIVEREVVLADIRQQVAAGAEHVTFGDPDFFNGVGHAMPIVEALHREFPRLTYDVTIKVEHLLKYRDCITALRDTGCLFVTSAVESVDDAVLEKLDKHHTRADFLRVVRIFRDEAMVLQPTFVPFTPWTTRENYCELLEVIREQELVENVAPIQLAIRLLIPAGSRLLELEEIRKSVGTFDEEALVYPWRNADERVDELCEELQQVVHRGEKLSLTRRRIFERIEEVAYAAAETDRNVTTDPSAPLGTSSHRWTQMKGQEIVAGAAIPHLNEPWYC